MGSFSHSTSSTSPVSSHLPLPGSSSTPSSPTAWSIRRKSRQNTILRSFVLFAILLTYLHLTSSPTSDELVQIAEYQSSYDDSLWSFQRSPRATNGDDGISFNEYLDSHFPLDNPKFPPPYIWVTLSDADFMPGAANLDVFARQLNEERKAKYGKQALRDTVVITLCLDEGCVEECEKRGMYCYGGYERRRPEQILKATWPKLASLIEILPQRDLFFIDADVALRQDPYPHLEPLMKRYDLLAQENNAFEHFNTGFLWMKRSQTIADAWAEVLEMDMQETSRDQYNFNTVLGTTQLRIDQDSEDPYERPLPSDFTASNSLKVHVLDQRLFRIMHLMEGDPVFERHSSLIHHMTCADDKWVKLYIAKAEGFWSDLDQYYTAPRRLVSTEHLSATQAQVTQLFKIVLAAAYYTGRSVLPSEFTTITDLTNSPFVARHSPSTFPLSHIERAFSIPILEPNYIAHAQSYLLGRSVLDPNTQRKDRRWTELPLYEKQSRTEFAISLGHTVDIDLRRYSTFTSLVERLRRPDLADSTHIRFVNAARDEEEPEWLNWDFSITPVGRLRTCERLDDPWRCDEFCRGVKDLKNGAVEGVWSSI